MDLAAALSDAPYPGRGLLVARTADDGICVLYWLSGRSEASRQRALVGEGEELRAVSTSGRGDDPLRHYRAARRAGPCQIVGNGDHVEVLAALLEEGLGVCDALCRLRPEPDELRTARIAAMVEHGGPVTLGAARATPGSVGTDHVIVHVSDLAVGTGLVLTTYRGDPASPEVGSAPAWVEVAPSLADQVREAWQGLDERFRVALAGRSLSRGGEWVCLP